MIAADPRSVTAFLDCCTVLVMVERIDLESGITIYFKLINIHMKTVEMFHIKKLHYLRRLSS